MTEPSAGSDLQGVKCRAIREGDHYVINGAKTFISNGLHAGLVGVVVNDGLRVVVEGIGRGGKTLPCKVQGKDMEKYRLHRARKGCLLPVKMKPAFIL